MRTTKKRAVSIQSLRAKVREKDQELLKAYEMIDLQHDAIYRLAVQIHGKTAVERAIAQHGGAVN